MRDRVMKTFKKSYAINAPLEDVYEALVEPEVIKEWSGAEAEMDIKPNGTFSLWGGSIHGVNLYITKNQIIQDWKEDIWEEYSRVTFNLSEKNGATTIDLIHELIPNRGFASIVKGWDEYYIGPLKELLES
jgi:activator of HSP90 ATPase